MSDSDVESIDALSQSGSTAELLPQLIGRLRSQGQYHELFEALKLQVRQELGLPLLYNDEGAELDEEQRLALEDRLLAACREVGLLLLEQGKLAEGWMYLRPVGDKSAVVEKLSRIEVTDENIDELLQVALQEGIDPARGFEIMLQQYGTCNSITTYDQVAQQLSVDQQQAVAGLLTHHLLQELTENVRSDIERQEQQPPAELALSELLRDRDWLFADHAYHIDTTHLNAVLRIARVSDDPAVQRAAAELAEYGVNLSSQYQYPGEEPFADAYEAHRRFFRALMDQDRAAGLEYFRDKAWKLDRNEHGAAPREVYIDLLARCERPAEALGAAIELLGEQPPAGLMVRLLELANSCRQYDELLAYCRQRGDLLSYGTVRLLQLRAQEQVA